MGKDVTTVVMSCDKYEDCWKPFFTLLKDYWPNFSMRILLATETKSFSFDGLNIETVNSQKKFWSDRVIETLKKVKTKFVLFFLDDFFINEKVNVKEIENCLLALKNDKTIATFSFGDSLQPDIQDLRFKNFDLRNSNQEYLFNTQAALWRKSDLLKLLVAGESPWQAENNGTFRAWVLMSKKKFYTVKHNGDSPISYEFGGAIHRGLWTIDTPKLLEDHETNNIDFSLRGFDPKPTSEWSAFRGNGFYYNKPKSVKIRLVNYLIAKNSFIIRLLKWIKRKNNNAKN